MIEFCTCKPTFNEIIYEKGTCSCINFKFYHCKFNIERVQFSPRQLATLCTKNVWLRGEVIVESAVSHQASKQDQTDLFWRAARQNLF